MSTLFANLLRRWLLPLCLLSTGVAASSVSAQTPETIQAFDEGNQFYRQGDYRSALDAYEKARKTGYTSGALFYNMGNAYYRLDETGQAVRYYEKARRLIPNDRALLHNLEIVQSRTGNQISRLPVPLWIENWRKFSDRASPWVLFLGGMLFYVIAAGIFIYRIRHGSQSPWQRRALAASIFGAVVLIAGGFAVSYEASQNRTVVVIADQAAVREEPDADALVTTEIHEGLALQVLDKHGQWIEVRLPNGLTGWMEQQATAEV